MRKVTVLYYSWWDEQAQEWYHNTRVFGSRKTAERFAENVKYNYPELDVELLTRTVE